MAPFVRRHRHRVESGTGGRMSLLRSHPFVDSRQRTPRRLRTPHGTKRCGRTSTCRRRTCVSQDCLTLKRTVVPAPRSAAPEARQDECRQSCGLRLLDELRRRHRLRLPPAPAIASFHRRGAPLARSWRRRQHCNLQPHRYGDVEVPSRQGSSASLLRRRHRRSIWWREYAAISVLRAASGSQSFPRRHCRLQPEHVQGHDRWRAGADPRAAKSLGQFLRPARRASRLYGRLLTPADDSIVGRGGPDGAVAVIS